MEDCYDVQAMDITIIIEGDGEVEINSIDLSPENSPWTGTYYSGLPIELSANGNGNDVFNFYWEVLEGELNLEDPTETDIVFDLNTPLVIVANFNACLSVPTDEIIGEVVVEEGSIWQYTFPSQFTNTSEWIVSGGDILFASSSENTIAVQWNFGTGDGQIVLSQYNSEGVLECLFVNIEIIDAQNDVRFECIGGDCVQTMGLGQYETLQDCLNMCDDNTSIDEANSDGVILFPNPVKDILSLVLLNKEVLGAQLYDIKGSLVYTPSIKGYYNNEIKELDVSMLSPGAYTISIYTQSTHIIKQFLVKE